jgi:hypothetical protein
VCVCGAASRGRTALQGAKKSSTSCRASASVSTHHSRIEPAHIAFWTLIPSAFTVLDSVLVGRLRFGSKDPAPTRAASTANASHMWDRLCKVPSARDRELKTHPFTDRGMESHMNWAHWGPFDLIKAWVSLCARDSTCVTHRLPGHARGNLRNESQTCKCLRLVPGLGAFCLTFSKHFHKRSAR